MPFAMGTTRMDRLISTEERRSRMAKRIAVTIVAIAAAAIFLAASVEWLRPSIDRRVLVTTRVTRGTVEATLDASGTVVPLVDQVVSSPVEARVVRIDRRAGDRVKSGDPLITLDNAASELEAARLNDRLAQSESATTQLRLTLDETLASLRAQLEQRKLDAEMLRYTAEQRATLRREGLIAEQDARTASIGAKKAQIEVRQLEEALVRATRSRDAQLAAAMSQLSTVRREREESRRQLDLAQLRADRDGVVTWTVTEEGATVRRGDIIARISDLSSYRVAATISDVHAARLAPAMRTHVTIDGRRLGGVIESVDPRIEKGVVRFYVTLDVPSDPLLRNNQRVDVSVVTASRNRALVTRRGSLGRTNASHAFVIRDGKALRVPVQFGLAGNETIEIREGLNEGDEVVISDMSDYENVRELRLN